MPIISEEEAQCRRRSVASVLGTHAMEGLSPDAETIEIFRRYEEGELNLDQFSEAMDGHAYALIAAHRSLAGAA